MSSSTVTTSMPVQQIRATAEEMIAAGGGKITAAMPLLTTAVLRKKFALVWFVLLLGVFYLIYWFAKRDQTIAVSYSASEGSAIVTIAATGPTAERVKRAILHMLARLEPVPVPSLAPALVPSPAAADESAEA